MSPQSADVAAQFRGALLMVGVPAAVSHLSALAIWGLPVEEIDQVQVLTGERHRIRMPGIVAHRRAGFAPVPPHAVVHDGVCVCSLDRSLVDAWSVLSGDAQRARLRALVVTNQRLRGRASLLCLLDRLDAGCRSELEIWGYEGVFCGPGMPEFRRQVPIRLDGRIVYLDLYADSERANFELDGARWHTDRRQRERDMRRDSALAAKGILVVRYSHDRLRHEPALVRKEALAILAARRAG